MGGLLGVIGASGVRVSECRRPLELSPAGRLCVPSGHVGLLVGCVASTYTLYIIHTRLEGATDVDCSRGAARINGTRRGRAGRLYSIRAPGGPRCGPFCSSRPRILLE